MKTVTVRLSGSTLIARMGGSGATIPTPELAVDAILRNEQARIPATISFRRRVLHILAERAWAGQGPDGEGRNWREPDEADRIPARIIGALERPPIAVELTNREW